MLRYTIQPGVNGAALSRRAQRQQRREQLRQQQQQAAQPEPAVALHPTMDAAQLNQLLNNLNNNTNAIQALTTGLGGGVGGGAAGGGAADAPAPVTDLFAGNDPFNLRDCAGQAPLQRPLVHLKANLVAPLKIGCNCLSRRASVEPIVDGSLRHPMAL